ncbi:porin [Qipengyuania atrilutea]|uniref:Porin n=1 Tax=Qipengyuania atrilutea TaxID=2744473 RepID=A0A850GYZ6_9SPHN|nr:porin [Actirhodobacter atriluteus]NVD43706.1 hypothetical protein [Actirhodobacter atriluteus]
MRKNTTRLGLLAISAAVPVVVATPAAAQDADSRAAEIAELRAQIEALTARVDELEREDRASVTTLTNSDVPPAADTAVAETPVDASEPPFDVAWKGAPVIEGRGGWSFKPRGRFNFDAGVVDAPSGTGVDDGFGSEARRIRLGVEGDIPGGFGYKVEVDFAEGAEITDAILTYGSGGATITIGQHNNFQSLDELTSSRFTSHIERAAFTDAFGFERLLGVSAEYLSGDVLIQGGVFSDNIEDLPGERWGVDGRAVYLPKIGDSQMHLGGSLHYADIAPADSLRYRYRPLVHFTDTRFVDTRSFDARSERGIGLESAFISGPFHAAGEAFWQTVSRPGDIEDADFFGGYAEVGYFLTSGDTRGYKAGVFDRVKPANPVGEGGFGALQVNLRYDYLDLTDGVITGGMQNGYIASLVWTPTDYTRFLMSYGRLAYDGAVIPAKDGETSYSVDSLGVRAQIDF